ncbi:MAG: hypothetical protein QOH61_2206 [Chloroflexota bacterium]|jgi:hypothetical protein|nr:hypothetical protein [Chloroflexota bacterium]
MSNSRSARRLPRALAGLRLPLLALAGLVVAHDAIFASEAGAARLGAALAESGHGAAWALLTGLSLAAATGVGALALARVRRLRRTLDEGRRASHRETAAARPPASALGSEVLSIWPRLTFWVVLGFTVQENVESLAGTGRLAGVEPLLISHPLALPILGLVTLALAAIDGLLRSHTRQLERQIRALRVRLPRSADLRPQPGWSTAARVPARDSIRRRPEAGRAPPLHARPVSA